MKNEQVFKSFGALWFDGKAVTARRRGSTGCRPGSIGAEGRMRRWREGTTMADEFRAMLYQRYTAPYAFASAYRHWGINE